MLNATPVSTVRTCNLPPIKVPEFSGKFADWEAYRDRFSAVVDSADISHSDKFSYLISNVHGRAFEIVNRYKPTVANYPLAWKDLVSYYENERRLVNWHLNELFSVKPMKVETSYALEKLRKAIHTPIASLKLLKRPTEHWSDIIVFIASSRFDDNTAKDWQKY